MNLIIGLFLLTYIALLILPNWRAWIALGMATVFLIFGFITFNDIVSTRINWNVFMIIGGTMIVVGQFIDSNMPAKLADIIIKQIHSSKMAVIFLAFFSGIISAFVDNVATVLIVAPIAIDIAKKIKTNPVPIVIAISIFANLQGFATLVGDTTSVMLAGTANMNFFDFFITEGKIGPFFIVQIGTILAAIVLWVILKTDNKPIDVKNQTLIKTYWPTFYLLLILGLLILASFVEDLPLYINGYITVGVSLISLLHQTLKNKNISTFVNGIKEIDFSTLVLLLGLFSMILGLENNGVIASIGQLIETLGGDNVFVIYTIVILVSVISSAFIDNIPYVATLLPVMMSLGLSLDLPIPPFLLLYGLLAGATLGGNLTPIGASANIAGIGLLKKLGYSVSFKDFFKIGLPITLTAVISGYLLIFFIYR
jgi:Na+/H+ antiporter NhaD/arsenite permease-like protein